MLLILILPQLHLLLSLWFCLVSLKSFIPSIVLLHNYLSFYNCYLFIEVLVILLPMINLQTYHKHSNSILHFCSSQNSLDSPIIFSSLLILITYLCCSLSFLSREYFQVFMLFHSFL